MSSMKKILGGVLAATLMVGVANPLNVQAANVTELREQGAEAAQSGDYDKAEEIFLQLINEGTDTYYENWYLGDIYRKKGLDLKATGYYDITWERLDSEPSINRTLASNWSFVAYNEGLDWYVEQIYMQAKIYNVVDLQVEYNYGRALMDNGKYAAAADSFIRALNYCQGESGASNRGTVMLQLAKCYNYLGREEEALQTAEEGFALCNKEGMYRDFIKEYYLEDGLVEVDEYISTYLAGKTNEEIGDFLKNEGYYEEAISYFENAQAEGKDTRIKIANTYASWGYPLKAVEIVEELLTEEPENIEYLNTLGSYYCDKLGRYEEAAALFEKIVEMNPSADGSRGNLAIVAQKNGDFDKAAEIRLQLLNDYPRYASVIKNYLKTQTSLTSEQALGFYSEYEDWTSNVELQAVYIAQNLSTNKLDNASLESFLVYFAQVDPNSKNYILCKNRANILALLGRYEEAIDLWNACRGLTDMMSYEIERGIGDCYKELGRYDEAVAQYEKGYELSSVYGKTSNLFDIYMRAGNTDAAKAVLDKYVQDGGDKLDVLELYLIWAGYAEDYEATLSYAEEYLAEYPSAVKAKGYKAAALKALGREEEANAVIADIDSITYSCSDTSKMIADSLLGRLDNAKAVYKVLLEQYPGNARTESNDYELKNLFYDAEFCQMAGRELWVKPEPTPEPTKEPIEEPESGETEPTVVEEEDTSDTSDADTIQEEGSVAVPVAMTVVAAVGALITVIVVATKKKRSK